MKLVVYQFGGLTIQVRINLNEFKQRTFNIHSW